MKVVFKRLYLIFSVALFSFVAFGGHGEHFLAAGERLVPGQHLNFGYAYLKLQHDGNLVLYVYDQKTWATDTNGQIANELVMQHDGNLVLYGPNGRILFASNTDGRSGAYLSLSEEGNGMKIYHKYPNIIWSAWRGRHY